MNRGVLIFAHNSRDVDYAAMAMVSGKLAKKNLNLPVSLVTDKSTVEWLEKSNQHSLAKDIFDQIIITERPSTENLRNLHDGSTATKIPFINESRPSAYDLTPYDQTLLIDSDFLVLSDRLNNYWNLCNSVLISSDMNDLAEDRRGVLDKWVSETGTKLYWATTVMFTKNKETEIFFDLVKHIKKNYKVYGDLYRFNTSVYRNDISFSVAKHIISGFQNNNDAHLPPVLTTIDKDELVSVSNTGNLIFMIDHPINKEKNYLASIKNVDVHIMNKQSIIRNKDRLMEVL